MAATKHTFPPFYIVCGGDSYLNEEAVRDMRRQASAARPDAETVELDASTADRYAFDEAVSPSLLSPVSIVTVTNMQNADEQLGDSMVAYCKQAVADPGQASIVIAQHEGGPKGKRLLEELTRAGARVDKPADLKKPKAKVQFVT